MLFNLSALRVRLLPLLFLNTSGAAILSASVTLIPSADTSIFQKNPSNNVGGSQSLAAGDTASVNPCRALLQFDIASALPPNVTVTSARLELTVVRTVTSSPATFDVHRLLVNWGEGDKDAGDIIGAGEPATDGEASWNARFHPASLWTTAGGAANIDYVSQFSASTGMTVEDTLVFESTPGLISDVQGWRDNPEINFGWLMKSRAEFNSLSARRFGSREHPENPPRLLVQFEEAAPKIKNAEAGAGQFCFQFLAQPGLDYFIEQRTELASGTWTVLTNFPPVTIPTEVTFCQLLETGPQFYRVGRR